MSRSAPPNWTVAALALATVAAVAASFLLPGVAAPLRFALGILAALGGGSLLLAMLGHLLGREWLEVIEDELLPGGFMLALAALLAVPLAMRGLVPDALAVLSADVMTPQRQWWFAPPGIALRFALLVAVGVALAVLLARWKSARGHVSAVGLPIFAAIFVLSALDWMVLYPPFWWTALQPIGFVVNQLTGALAIAFVHNLAQREPADREAMASIAAALLTLALLGVWIGYVQYLIGWYGNLPEAARWYQARMEAAGWLVPAFAALQVAGVAILLFSRSHGAMLAASLALLGAYAANMIWTAGPTAPRSAAEWAITAALLSLGFLWHMLLNRWYDARVSDARSQPGSALR